MILWFHRKERDRVHVYKTPNGDPPKRLATGDLDSEFLKDSICFRGFLKATGIRLRTGELQKMDWSRNGTKFSEEVIKVRFEKKKTICDCPGWIVQVVKDVIEELRLETFIGPPLPDDWTKEGRPFLPRTVVTYSTTGLDIITNVDTSLNTVRGTNVLDWDYGTGSSITTDTPTNWVIHTSFDQTSTAS